MASFTISNKCVGNKECKKNGIIKCDGCLSRFCSDHFSDHRRHLETRLELLCLDRDQFHDELAQISSNPTESLSEIDHWEQQTLAHVKKTASDARNRIRQLAATKSSSRELDQFSNELRKRKENEDYFEHDIERLTQQLEHIRRESKQLSKINISHTLINWETIIQINCLESKQLSHNLFYETSLLNLKQQQILNRFCEKPGQQWKLIYRGTRDGFGKGKFLNYCANQGPTMTVILANGYLFGGYTTTNWKKTDQTISNTDPSAFLFTLTNPHQIPPTKYPINSEDMHAIRSRSNHGPIFGNNDIFIYPYSNTHEDNYSSFPQTYCDITGMGNQTFTGTRFFQTTEIEVYTQVWCV